MIGTNEHIKAYTELNCLIKYFPKKYKDRIPKNLVQMIQEKSDDKYSIKIDPNKKLNEQNLSRKTEILLAILKYNYWCENNLEKEKLKVLFYENENKYQERLIEKYNPENIFANKKKINEYQNNVQQIQKENSLIEFKEKFSTKLKRFIKRIFNNKS